MGSFSVVMLARIRDDHSCFAQPLLDFRGDKLRAVVAADVFRSSMLIDQLRKDLLHFTGGDLPIHMNTQALPGILIEDIEHS